MATRRQWVTINLPYVVIDPYEYVVHEEPAGLTRVGAKGCDEGEEGIRLFLVKVA